MHLHPRLGIGAIALTLGMGVAVGDATAALTPSSTIRSELGSTGTGLELARIRLRLGARSSRFRVGGFRRGGSCLPEGQELLPLVPPLPEEQAENGEDPVDLTASDSPTFWVYVPPMEDVKTAQFTLQDEMGTVELVNVEFELSGESGIVGVKADLDDVEGDVYYWQMAVQCNAESPDENPAVSGWIAHTEVAAPTGTPSEQATFYAENGIWQDAVSVLATALYADQGDATAIADWEDLMTAAGLDEFATVPIVQVVE